MKKQNRSIDEIGEDKKIAPVDIEQLNTNAHFDFGFTNDDIFEILGELNRVRIHRVKVTNMILKGKK